MKYIKLLTGLILTIASLSVKANTADKLLKSISITIDKDGDIARYGKYGKAIKDYMNKGYINSKPNIYRADYVDYYFLQKPAYLLGHELKIIEEEYMSEYVGCCASEGVGVVLKLSGSTNKLKKFAQRNRCSIEPINFKEYMTNLGIKNPKIQRGSYITMSCRERDLHRE